MMLRASPTVPALLQAQPMRGAGGRPAPDVVRMMPRAAAVRALVGEGGASTDVGFCFEPFQQLRETVGLVATSPDVSLARYKYSQECESAVNDQINVEYNVSYAYHSIFSFFDRDNVALKGIAKFFKESSEEERGHAEKLMKYQNKRGGKVRLSVMTSPPSEFDHPEKGDALYAMELALGLEKLVNQKLLNLHRVASDAHDVQLTDFIESEFLEEQVEAVKKIAEYVAQLRRVGKGHGVWHFDQALLHEVNGGA